MCCISARIAAEAAHLPDLDAILGREVQRGTFLHVKRHVEFRNISHRAVGTIHRPFLFALVSASGHFAQRFQLCHIRFGQSEYFVDLAAPDRV